MKLNHVNDNSVNDAIATPPITGNNAIYTGIGKNCCKNIPDNNADTAGSAAFTICVKLTAPAPSDTTAPICVNVCNVATGNNVLISSNVNSGA